MDKIRIMVVDAQPAFREGVRSPIPSWGLK
jgi:hypothetical protein